MNKNVIITGSQGNLGKVVTKKFASEGYQVIGTVLPGRSNKQSQGEISYHEVDLLNTQEVETWTSKTIGEISTIDAIVCLVGGFAMTDLLKSGKEEIDKMIDLNFFTTFNVIKAFLTKLVNQKSPVHIVLISAMSAVEKGSAKGVFPYSLSKSMVLNLAEAINAERGGLNATATTIVPGIIDTPPNRDSMPDANFNDWVTPESIANKIFFVCSDQGKDLRETTLKVYGDT